MNIFDKIDCRIDYYNNYSIRKGLETLRIEYLKASRYKNHYHANGVVEAVNKIHSKVKHLDKYSGNMLDIISLFINDLNKRLKNDFGK